MGCGLEIVFFWLKVVFNEIVFYQFHLIKIFMVMSSVFLLN